MVKARLNRLERQSPLIVHPHISSMTAQEIYKALQSNPQAFGTQLMQWAVSLSKWRYASFYKAFMDVYRAHPEPRNKSEPEPDWMAYCRALTIRFHAPHLPMRVLGLRTNLNVDEFSESA